MRSTRSPRSSRPSRVLATALVTGLLTSGLVLTQQSPAAALPAASGSLTRAYTANTYGGIGLVGNTVLTCDTAGTHGNECTTALTASSSATAAGTTSGLINNNLTMKPINEATGASGVFDLSTATIGQADLPSGASVLHASLYWQGILPAGAGTTCDNGNGTVTAIPGSHRSSVVLGVPGQAGFVAISGQTLSTTYNTANTCDVYSSYADVTTQVEQGQRGTYAVGNVGTSTGSNSSGAWAIVISWGFPTAAAETAAGVPAQLRNLTTFDGLLSQKTNATPTTVTFSGFTVPAAGGPVPNLGLISSEGDLSLLGDAFGVNGTTLNGDDPAARTNNFFNSINTRATSTGAYTDPAAGSAYAAGSTTYTPRHNYANTLGLDAKRVALPGGLVPAGATSATATFSTTQDVFAPQALFLATPMNPQVTLTKTATYNGADAQGVTIPPGGKIVYTVVAKNTGDTQTQSSLYNDVVPAGTTYLPGSTTENGNAQSDAADADNGEYDAPSRTVTVRYGPTGTPLAPGASLSSSFTVAVDGNRAQGFVLSNTASGSYVPVDTLGNPIFPAAPQPTSSGTVSSTVANGPAPVAVKDSYSTPVNTALTITAPGVLGNDTGNALTATIFTQPTHAAAPVTVNTNGSFTYTPKAGVSGTDSFTYRVTDAQGQTATAAASITIVPQAVDDSAITDQNRAVVLSPLTNDVGSFNPTSVLVSVGPSNGIAVPDNAGTITYTPKPGFTGTDSYTYTVRDVAGQLVTAVDTITVDGTPAANPESTSTKIATPVVLNVLANDVGQLVPGSVVVSTAPANGTSSVNASTGAVTYTPTAGYSGTDTFVYSVTDRAGAVVSATDTVTVAPPPVTTADSYATPVDAVLTVAAPGVLGNDTGTGLTAVVAQPGSGKVTLAKDGSFVYTPVAGSSGKDQFTYTVTDSLGQTATDTVTVTVVPSALDDSAVTDSGVPVTLSPLANDKGSLLPGSVTIMVAPTNGTAVVDTATGRVTYTPTGSFTGTDSYTYGAKDAAGQVVTAVDTISVNAGPVAAPDSYSVAAGSSLAVPAPGVLGNDSPSGVTITGNAQPAHGTGTVTVAADGSFSYTPDPADSGPDSFSYTIKDAQGQSATATVSLTVLPKAVPEAASTPVGTAVTLPVLANDKGALAPTSVSVTVAPANGSTSVNAATGAVTYRPSTGFTGTDVFTYAVSDSSGQITSATDTVTVTPDPPVAKDDAVSTTGGTTVTLDPRANDTDPNGGALTITGVSNVTNGTVSCSATRCTYAPAAGFTGTDSFAYTVTNAAGLSSTATVHVSVTNVAPSFTSSPDNTSQAVQTGGGLAPLRATDSDPGQVLAYAVATGALPSGVTLGADGTFAGSATTPGTYTATVTVSDGFGGTATTTLKILVTQPNRNPVAADDAASTGVATSVSIPVLANDTDPDGNALTVTMSSQPANGSVSCSSSACSYTPTAGFTGTDSFFYTVSDGQGGVATAKVTVTVTASAPAAVNDTVSTVGGAALSFDPRTNDTDPQGSALTISASSPPAHGTVTCTATGCTYTPTSGYVGPDSFTYTVRNAYGLTSTATVAVTVTDTPPAFSSSPDNTRQSVALGGTPAPLQATDANGDPLTYAVTGGSLPTGVTLTTDGAFAGTAGTAGTFTATVTVSDGHGGTATTTLTLTVAADRAPVFGGASGNTAQTVPVGGTPVPVTATDPDPGQALSYAVTGGSLPTGLTLGTDGTFAGTVASGASTSTATITVTDPYGKTDATVLTITVIAPADAAPVATNDTATTAAGAPVTTQVLANDTDPDKDPLTVQSVSQPAHGTVTCTSTACSDTPTAGYRGPDSYTYVVSDGRGLTDTGTVTVTVTAPANRPPVFDGTTSNTTQTVPVGGTPQPVHATDPDGDPISYTVTSGTLPAGITLKRDGTFSGTVQPGATTTMVTITASDNRPGGTATTDLALTIVASATGVPPVAVDDSATTPYVTAVTTQVLANDTDADGNTLTVSSVTQPAHGTVSCTSRACSYTPAPGFSGTDTYDYAVADGTGYTDTGRATVAVANAAPAFDGTSGNTAQTVPVGGVPTPLSAVDPNGDRLTYTVTGGNLPAGVTLRTDGTFGGAATRVGSATVTITVTDGNGGSDTTTLVVTVAGGVNSAPTAVNDSKAVPGVATTVSVLGNDRDPNGDPLTVAAFAQPTHGTVTCSAAGVCTYTPAAGYSGPDSFAYTVSDGKGGTDTATVALTVTAANRPPLAANDSAATVEDRPVTLTKLLGNDADRDGNPLTITGHGPATHGAATCTPTTCTYTPAKNYSGPDAFTYTVSDGKGGTSTATVSLIVTPVNDPPAATADRVTTPTNKPATVTVLGNDTDPEGDALTVTATGKPAHGTASCSAAGHCTYTPDAGYAGTDAFSYTVSDGKGGTSVGTVMITVANGPPTPADDSVTVVAGTATLVVVVSNDTDPDRDPLHVVASSHPAHGTVSCSATSCTYTSDDGYTGPDAFAYTVTDGHGHTASATVTVTVDAAHGGGRTGSGAGSGGADGGPGGGTGSGTGTPTGSGTGTAGGSGGTGDGSGLPFTGAPIQQSLGLAGGLLGLGLVLLLVTRRRRDPLQG